MPLGIQMNSSKRILFPLLLGLGLLGACSEQKEQFKQEFDNAYRTEFIESFTRQCIDSIPPAARLSAEQKQSVCSCAANHAVEVVSATEVAQAATGKMSPELQAKLRESFTPCKNELEASRSAPTAPASQPQTK